MHKKLLYLLFVLSFMMHIACGPRVDRTERYDADKHELLDEIFENFVAKTQIMSEETIWKLQKELETKNKVWKKRKLCKAHELWNDFFSNLREQCSNSKAEIDTAEADWKSFIKNPNPEHTKKYILSCNALQSKVSVTSLKKAIYNITYGRSLGNQTLPADLSCLDYCNHIQGVHLTLHQELQERFCILHTWQADNKMEGSKLWEKVSQNKQIQENDTFKHRNDEAIATCFKKLSNWAVGELPSMKDYQETIPNGLNKLRRIMAAVDIEQDETLKEFHRYLKEVAPK